MTTNMTTSTDKKLLVKFRLEPGCLGPDGADHIVNFCEFAQNELKSINIDFAEWKLSPRFDKSLPEIEYSVLGKRLNMNQVSKYFKSFNQELADCEELLDEKLAMLIERYLNR